jgi:hypothetical protein
LHHGLVFDRESLLAQRFRFGKKQRAQFVEPLDWVVTAVAGAVAVGPFVVAGHEYERERRAVKKREPVFIGR